MKEELERTLKELLSKIESNTPSNEIVSISIAILNLANSVKALESK